MIDSIGGSVAKFKMCLFNTENPAVGDAAAEEIYFFNFTPGTSNYIRDQFNTNPQLIKANKNFGLTNKSYFLGETYEESIESVAGTDTTAGKQTAILLALLTLVLWIMDTERNNHQLLKQVGLLTKNSTKSNTRKII